jgi:uncharacterized protein YigE (DUF2233 family)
MRIAVIAGLLLLAAGGLARAVETPDLCVPADFEGTSFTVCTVDSRTMELGLYAAREDGSPFGSFAGLESWLAQRGRQLVFGMNAGMYDDKQQPIGLYVENGVRHRKANTRNGFGNFHLKPNGVFYIDQGKVGVLETSAYLKSGIAAEFATQSGPMLVIDGVLHPKFGAASTSYKRRNGVGVVGDHTALFVMAEEPVTFHAFARFFRDELRVKNALFFDGSISSLHYGGRSDGFFPLGPIVAVTSPQ